MRIVWLTPEQVKKRATTPEKALKVSIETWEAKRNATNGQAKWAYARGKMDSGSPECGMCIYYGYGDKEVEESCGVCPVHDDGGRVCCDVWAVAIHLFYVWETTKSEEDWLAFQTKARKVLARLKKIQKTEVLDKASR